MKPFAGFYGSICGGAMRKIVSFLGMACLGLVSILVLKTALASGTKECSSGCVITRSYDVSRDDVNPNETILKASNLSSLKAEQSVDLLGAVHTQPLYVSNLATHQGTKNVVFVATEENWVYALDGDNIENPPLWQTNLNQADESSIPLSHIPRKCSSISPEIGITGTPVIDLTKNVLYVVSAHFNSSTQTITQRLNTLKLGNGVAAATALDIPTAFQSISFPFDVTVQQQRAGLALAHDASGNPLIYIAWASYCDQLDYSGKVGVFTLVGGALSVLSAFDDEAAGGKPVPGPKGGIWMGGAAPAISTRGGGKTPSVYLSTGNGSFVPGAGYGESVLRFGGSSSTNPLALSGSYTASAWKLLNYGSGTNCISPLHMPPPYPANTTVCSPGDFEVGSAGVILAEPSGSGNVPAGSAFVVLAAGKEGVFYVIDPANMKHKGADTKDPCGAYAIQCLGAIQLPLPCCNTKADYGNRGGAAFWPGNATYPENVLYVVGSQDSAIRAYQMIPGGGGTFNTSLFGSAKPPNPDKNGLIPYPGAVPVISWNSNGGLPTDAILWVYDTSAQAQAKFFAYQAVPNSAGGPLPMVWSDKTNAPAPSRFMIPTVINGHVYVAGGKPVAGKCAAGACLGRVVAWQ